MKTIKIIELLTKIANGKEVPNKIKWRDDIWKYDDRIQDYTNEHLMLFEQLKIIRTKEFLNDEVEILDEDDEEIKIISSYTYNVGRVDESNIEEYIHTLFKQQAMLIENQKKIIERLQHENSKDNV